LNEPFTFLFYKFKIFNSLFNVKCILTLKVIIIKDHADHAHARLTIKKVKKVKLIELKFQNFKLHHNKTHISC